MKHLIIVVLTFLAFSTRAQSDFSDFVHEEYDFSDKALNSPFMDSIGYSSCYHWRYLFNEIRLIEKTKVAHYFTEHTLVQLNDVQSVEDFNTQYFAINDFQNLVDFKVRVIKDGKVLFSAGKSDATEMNTEEGRYMQLAVKSLTPGCYVESIETDMRTVENTGTFNVQFTVPVREFKSLYFTPITVGIKAKLNNLPGACVSELINDRYVNYYSLSDVPVLQMETYAFPKAERGRIDYAFASTENGTYVEPKWADKGSQIFANFTNGFEEAKGSIKKMLKTQGISSQPTELDKVFALESYLKQNFELGDDYYSKKFPDDEFKSHTITKFNMNRLFVMSLMVMEIPFEIVLTGDRESVEFEKDFVSEHYIQSVLCYFPSLDIYIQPIDQGSRLPYLAWTLYDQDALHVKLVSLGGTVNPVGVVKHIPTNNPEKSKNIEAYTVKFDEGMSTTTTHYMHGYAGCSDSGLRLYAYYMKEEDVKKIYEDIVKSGQSNASVSNLEYRNYNLSSRDEMEKPFELEADLSGSDLLEFAGDQVLFHVGMVIGQQSELYNEKPRQNPIDVSFAHRYDRKIVVEIPEGYKLGGLEALNQKITCEKDGKVLAQFVSNYEVKENQLIITIDESYFVIRLNKDLYDTFSKVINAAADFNKIDLVLTK